MKTNLCSALFIMLVAGCATEQLDPSGPDFDDPDAKLDGASQPAGMYKVIEPTGGFGEGEPRIALLDLRSDGTVYELEYGPVAYDDYNYGEGQTEIFGTFKFTKDSHGNKYIRLKDALDPDSSWRWRYRVGASTSQLAFIYDTGEVGFKMKREARPTAAFVAKVKTAFTEATRTAIPEPTPSHWTGELPDTLSARVRDLGLAEVDKTTIKASSVTVDGDHAYILEWKQGGEAHAEVFAQSDQLLAKTKTVEPLVWAELRP